MKTYFKILTWLISGVIKNRHRLTRFLDNGPSYIEAFKYSQEYSENSISEPGESESRFRISQNPLQEYFQNHKKGRGIWKCEHYFDIYHRHFSKFIGTKVNLLEIGVYSGGSLEMWRDYLGDESRIFGVDIEEACKHYENEHISISIGDQGDQNFWERFKEKKPGIDILIDDGGHTFEQQKVTLQEMLPTMNPGSVYLCEDIVGGFNKFSAFASGLVGSLNHYVPVDGDTFQSDVNDFQKSIYSIHFYPMVAVIEKNEFPLKKIAAPKHGTEWQPFFD